MCVLLSLVGYSWNCSIRVGQLEAIKTQGGEKFCLILWHLHDKFIASSAWNTFHVLTFFRLVHVMILASGSDIYQVAIRTFKTYWKNTLWCSSHWPVIWADYLDKSDMPKVWIIQNKSLLTFHEIWKSSWPQYYDTATISNMSSNRIVICDKCGRELEVRSAFAHITVANHKKSCKSWLHEKYNVILLTLESFRR